MSKRKEPIEGPEKKSKENNVNLIANTERKAQFLDNIVDEIVNKYSKGLDEYIRNIRDILSDTQNPITTAELEDCVLNIPTELYFISEMSEKIGIRDDISKMLYQEAYNRSRDEATGTVADKSSYAELQTQHEKITNVIYNRAFKIIKAKNENAQELLESCKKVLSLRIAEMDITRVGGNR